jgi:hypothetical protein
VIGILDKPEILILLKNVAKKGFKYLNRKGLHVICVVVNDWVKVVVSDL